MLRWGWLFSTGLWLFALAGCGDDVCGSMEPATNNPNTPIIEKLEMLEQLTGDPWTLVFCQRALPMRMGFGHRQRAIFLE